MQPVRVNRVGLIEILEANKAKHIRDFEEAFEGFRRKALAEMEKNLQLAGDRDTKDVRLIISLSIPQSHAEEYDSVLGLLKMGTDDHVLLDINSYRQYVQDEWSWKRAFDITNSSYK